MEASVLSPSEAMLLDTTSKLLSLSRFSSPESAFSSCPSRNAAMGGFSLVTDSRALVTQRSTLLDAM